ncbi:sensor domain-containing protein [Demequina sp. TTPB684]|uniref:sensor histidine kinase n=1 Tax=unclassified Demequina TaxID=2620311 RepID=UPI001CF30A97|nr:MULTISPECIES: sensor domain-containing protein [unclassified Demequina]MCB2412272.1 sensor domain-containing protein [Demequina sp. TTPB684]UPU88472.1 sensor domain-containing protein [Demequina sp. TMPB413]
MTERNAYVAILFQARFWREAAYLLLGLPLGILWGVYAVTMYAVGVSLVIVWVGVPLLVFTHVSMRWIGASERLLANSMIDARIAAPPARRSARRDRPDGREQAGTWSSLGRWAQDVMFDAHAWRVALWCFVRITLGAVGFSFALLAVVLPITAVSALVQAAVYRLGLANWYGDPGNVNDIVSFWVLVGAPVVLLLIPAFAWPVRALALLHASFGRWALGASPSEDVKAATERAELAEEQVRIDQELHDSIGHMITMNIIQAGAGAHVFDTDPEFARQALRNIEERGRAAMGELDRIISAIRGDQPEARTPLPGIDDIARLIEESRTAGMEVSYDAQYPKAPAAVGRAAFTVVREALTNAARHAPGAPVAVRIAHDADALGIEVINGKPTEASAQRPHAGGGRGLSGIRDRVTLLGGRSSAGPEANGFVVRALLPLEATLSETVADASSPWASLREKVSA